MLVVNGSMTCFQKHTKCDLEVCTHDINKFIFVLLYLNRRFFWIRKINLMMEILNAATQLGLDQKDYIALQTP